MAPMTGGRVAIVSCATQVAPAQLERPIDGLSTSDLGLGGGDAGPLGRVRRGQLPAAPAGRDGITAHRDNPVEP
jgi:hypothetical protein